MPDENVTPEQVQEVLKANGINSIEDLAKLLAEDQNSKPGSITKLDELGKSWIIRVWELKENLEDIQIKNLPKTLGGEILKNN